ncbi:hypothetical protein SETIT_9G548700v2 [Setaria italica]|uniref:Uncharacterized protein n=1 Tax=Setaria italica TaxID=4555 RepID=A0A368SWA0_SETIT|nr:hypothetical protein SETIT_9G548700v2 [Setaria italica]
MAARVLSGHATTPFATARNRSKRRSPPPALARKSRDTWQIQRAGADERVNPGRVSDAFPVICLRPTGQSRAHLLSLGPAVLLLPNGQLPVSVGPRRAQTTAAPPVPLSSPAASRSSPVARGGSGHLRLNPSSLLASFLAWW